MSKIISFRFDDGLWEGCNKAIKILHPATASFYIVKDWMADFNLKINDDLNIGHYHGSIKEWRQLALAGQDIQGHSISHDLFSKLSPEERSSNLSQTRDFLSSIHPGPYSFCYPYNALTEDDLISHGFDHAGFSTKPSKEPIQFNKFDNIDRFKLKSWAVRHEDIDDIYRQLFSLESQTWVILAFHSIDDEGFMPWPESKFGKFVEKIKEGFDILNVSEALKFIDTQRDESISDISS